MNYLKPHNYSPFSQSRSFTGNNFRIYIILILLLAFSPFYGVSQTNTIDSLKLAISHSPDSVKPRIFLSIAKEYRNINYDSVIAYGNKSIDYALYLEDNNMIIKSMIELAYINISIGERERSLDFYNQAIKLCTEEDNQELLAKIYLDKKRYYFTMSDYASSISSLDTALEIINSNNLSSLKPIVYLDFGDLYLSIQDYTISKYYSKQAIFFSEMEEDKTSYINSLSLLGKVFFLTNELDSAFFYFSKALDYARRDNNKVELQKVYRRISGYYIEIEDYDKSNIYIDSSIYYCNELVLPSELASLITFKAHIASLRGDYNTTLKYNLEALELRKQTGHQMSICASYLNIGGNYIDLGDYEKAHSYLNKAIYIAKSQNVFFYLVNGYDKLHKLNELEGNFKEALHFHELKTSYNDSIITKKTNEKVTFLKNQFELEKVKTISEKLKVKQTTNLTIFLIISTILFISIIILLSRINYLKVKTNKEVLKAKEKAEENEFFLKESQKVANIGSYKFDLENNIWNSSEVLNQIYGISENYNRTLESWINIIHKDDREMMTKYFEDEIVSKGKPFNKVYRITRLYDLKTRWVLGMGILDFDSEGKVISMIGTVQDITEQKLAEIELSDHREHLEKMVEERTADLNAKNEELERYNKLFVGREYRIKELREQIKQLKERK